VDVKFRGEEGVDAGGLTREWYALVSREMFNPDYGLFRLSEDGTTYQPHPKSFALVDAGAHLAWFRFVGRVLGKAVADGYLLDVHFTRSLYKHLLGMPVEFDDVQSLDPEYHKSLSLLMQHGPDALGLELAAADEGAAGAAWPALSGSLLMLGVLIYGAAALGTVAVQPAVAIKAPTVK
jgi:E3 ubiquitin-protein ligase HUWE1